MTVQVREVLPKVKDDQIDVELSECAPKLATGGRFDRDREERGVLTWEVTVANGGKAEIDWQSKITWPADRELATIHGGIAPVSGGASLGLLIGSLAFAGALALARRLRRRHSKLPLVVVAGFGLAAFTPVASAQQAVESRIERVTVSGSGAMVERVATLPGAGSFATRGLPAAADPTSIRVRIEGGEVVGVDVRERRERTLPDERLDQLRATIRKLSREKQQLDDERAALQTLAGHLTKLFAPATGAPPLPASPGAQVLSDEARPGVRVWAQEHDFLATRYAELQESDARQRVGAGFEGAGARGRARVAAGRRGGEHRPARRRRRRGGGAGGGALRCELSYLVEQAGPGAGLRAARAQGSHQRAAHLSRPRLAVDRRGVARRRPLALNGATATRRRRPRS